MALLTSLPGKVYRSNFTRFGIAIASAALALLVAGALTHFTGRPVSYLAALAAVAFSSWYCGLGPSIACAAFSLLGVEFFFVRPNHPFDVPQLAGWPGTLAFLLATAVIVIIAEANRREEQRLRDIAEELAEHVRRGKSELDRTNQDLRELTARLLNLQDEERRRIARELHDNTGQALSVLAINLSAVANDLGRLINTVHTVKDSASLVKQMSDDIRTMSYLLHPPLLDEMGLLSALQWYVEGFTQRSKIAVEFDCPRALGRFAREVETAIFRIVQECLTNILRHSGSTTASIHVAHSDGHLQLEVCDAGKGITPQMRSAMDSGGTLGVGLRGMRERIQQLGGRLQITSDGVGTGTRVLVRLPAPESASPETASTEVA